ncbi:sodium- and chloride-dependent neutral and basic amino acid transporter B(0+)-like isoform X2 [Pleurodeles waltl]|uniref:sodium- and chloride-dependent neutral and basic amino acid transporter B(0+)-like isoform X2 n=1 Tax=Pleurodeles waltl TaxID=8319 RepID=UPI00370938C8
MGWRNISLPACLKCCRKNNSKDKELQTTNIENSTDQNNPEREVWSNKADYLLSLIGYAVGLGNVWRFPYLAYKNGGGAYLIPYIIMLVFAGLPLFFLECSLGQFSSSGPIAMWKILPMLKGVGVTMVLISSLVAIYYNVIIAYSLYYLFASFRSVLPWADCGDWADENCRKDTGDFCNGNVSCRNNSEGMELPSQQYWTKVALRQSSGMDETGHIVWYLALCLLLAWILVGAALCKGIKSSGKVVYFTAVFPYVVLIILLGRGASLDGAVNGIDFFIGTKSDISKLSNAEGWKDAATQVFYSLSTAWGGLMALSSYNKFHNNCYVDTLVVCFINLLTSLLAGFVIFSILGHMAHVSGKSVETVAKEETMTTAIQDAYPQLMKRMRIPITAGCCVVLFLLGLSCVTEAGIYWVNLIDYFTGGWALLIAAVLELIGICWVYGANRFIEDIEMMLGKKHWIFWLYWRACWYVISPLLLAVILVWSLVTFSTPKYGTYEYPPWAVALGWLMIVFCIMWIPIIAAIKIVKSEGSLWQRIVKCGKPAADWGPALPQNRGERYKHMKDHKLDKETKEDLELPTVAGMDNISFQRE